MQPSRASAFVIICETMLTGLVVVSSFSSTQALHPKLQISFLRQRPRPMMKTRSPLLRSGSTATTSALPSRLQARPSSANCVWPSPKILSVARNTLADCADNFSACTPLPSGRTQSLPLCAATQTRTLMLAERKWILMRRMSNYLCSHLLSCFRTQPILPVLKTMPAPAASVSSDRKSWISNVSRMLARHSR